MLFVFLQFSLSKTFPPWPPAFTFHGTWKVPSTNLSTPVTVVQTSHPTRQYMNKNHGMNQIWRTNAAERLYRKIVGNGTDWICYGLNQTLPYSVGYIEWLPKPEGYVKMEGNFTYHGKLCDLYTKNISYAKEFFYKLYVDPVTNFPVAYVLKAIPTFVSHYDVYVVEYDEFYPYPLEGIWNFPCTLR